MLALLPIALVFQVQVGVRVGKDSTAEQRRQAAQAEVAVAIEEGNSRKRRPVRRVTVTDEMVASAFKDASAKSLLLRARKARLEQDSALASYDATTYQRFSVGLGFKAVGRERLALRHEEATHVTWARGVGAQVEMKGARSVIPIAQGEKDAKAEFNGMSTIPYFPGREDLWFGGASSVRDEVDEREFVHPIATGAEAYYTYETGDSVIMRLPDGKTLTLRELKITARKPKWNLSVGSFWFDEATAHLVRAVYRTSQTLDIWGLVDESIKDTTVNAPGAGRNRNNQDDAPPFFVKAMFSPAKVEVSAITVEYGLYEQRFWLPRNQALEGKAQMGFVRVPITIEEKFRYASVNALEKPLLLSTRTPSPVVALRDSLDSAKTPTAQRDSLLRQARRARVKELASRRDSECAATGVYTTRQRRYDGAVEIEMKTPCDSTILQNSKELPASIYDPGEEVFGSAEREQLIKALDFGLQAAWGPQLPRLGYGLSLTRYNRVEGLGTGLTLTSELGQGYTAVLGARGSIADKQINADLTLARSNGRSTVRGTVYRRLDVMNDYGTPLSFGASLGALLYARDEGAYYRTWGGELTGESKRLGGNLDWRLFGEQQWKADLTSRWTLFGGGNDSRFIGNPAAEKLTEYGASLRLRHSVGLDPQGWRLLTDLKLEGAAGDSAYGRGLFDATISHPITHRISGSLTAAGGYTAGAVPVQRRFYLGGSQTIRGETALTQSGNAFWMARGELGTNKSSIRQIVFADLGWAGRREDFSKPGRPMAGVGFGQSFLDGLIRYDISRGLYPTKQTRLDIYLEARF
jgi:hypothetical protein